MVRPAKWRVTEGWRVSNCDVIFGELALCDVIITKNRTYDVIDDVTSINSPFILTVKIWRVSR